MKARDFSLAKWPAATLAGVVCWLFCQGAILQAASYSWFGGSGDWNVATNWIPAGVPGSGDEAYISSGQVNIGASSNPVSVSYLYHDGGTISGASTLVVENYYSWRGGALGGGGGRLVVMGGISINNSNTVVLGGWTLETLGYGQWVGQGPILMQSGAVLTNFGYFSWETAQPIISGGTNVCLANVGTISINVSTGMVVLNPAALELPLMTFRNEGQLVIEGGGLRLERTVLELTDSSTIRFYLHGTNGETDNGLLETYQPLTLNGRLEAQLDPYYLLWPQEYEVILMRGDILGDFLSTGFYPWDRTYYLYASGWPETEVRLLSHGISPYIYQNAESRELLPGQEFVIICEADGTHPLYYQWFKDGEPISGANGLFIQVFQADYSHQGDYYCIVTNFYGAVTSQVAHVSVVAPPRLVSFAIMGSTLYVTAQNSPDAGELVLEKSTNPETAYNLVTNVMGAPGETQTVTDFIVSPEIGHFYRIATRAPLGTLIYATNVFGYWAYQLQPGYNLIAQPFITSDNSLNSAFMSVPDTAHVVLISSNRLETFYYSALYGWMDETMTPSGHALKPWEGFYFYNPLGSAVWLRMMGELPVGNLTNAVPQGKCVLSPLFPRREFSGFPAAEGDRVWIFDEWTQQFVMHQFINGGWQPNIPWLFPHKAFWFEPAVPVPGGGSNPRLWVDWVIPSGYPDQHGYYSTPVVYEGPAHTLVPQTPPGWPPSILFQPVSQTVPEGQPATFEVTAGGDPPLTYQWFHQGMPILSATNPVFTIAEVIDFVAGSYYVVVSNPYGAVTSQVATLTVGPPPQPPSILREPQDMMVTVGKVAEFSVEVSGAGPWSFQWFFQGAPVPGATWTNLLIYNVAFTNSGGYHVVVSNAFGAVTSRVATLTVFPPPPVVAWGPNWNHRAEVPPDLTNVVGLATHTDHCLALKRDGRVVGWGLNDFGQLYIPLDLNDAVAVATGQRHGIALRANGTVRAWGANDQGQLNVPGGLSNVVAVAAGIAHNVVLLADGQLVAWGSGVAAPPGWSNVVAIASGYRHTLALLANGKVLAWGDNAAGQLLIPPGLSNVVGIAAGSEHSVALRADGTVVAWGDNTFGQTSVPAGLSNVVAISAGLYHNLALRADGTVVSWGDGPQDAPANLSNVVGVAAGIYFNLALIGHGPPYLPPQVAVRRAMPGEAAVFSAPAAGQHPLVFQWKYQGVPIPGANKPWLVLENVRSEDAGEYQVVVQNAQGTVTSQTMRLEVEGPPPQALNTQVIAWGNSSAGPLNVPGGLTNIVALAAGWNHSVGLRADGLVVAWGDNSSGQTSVPLGLTDVITIAAGGYHTLALRQDGTVVAWGNNGYGQCTVPPELDNVVAIGAGEFHSLALTGDGRVVAWGYNYEGQGNVPAGLHDVVAISAGGSHNMALCADGTVAVWGNNCCGQVNVPPGLSNVVAIAAGEAHCLALKADGTVVAWGDNETGATNVPEGLNGVAAIAAGMSHSLALRMDGSVVSWGKYQYSVSATNVPGQVVNAVTVSAGKNYSLALIGDCPPRMGRPVEVRRAIEGGQAVFHSLATGYRPMNYQWYFNGVPVAAANQPWLVLSGIQAVDAGQYAVVVGNSFGVSTSAIAQLQIIPSLPPPQVVVWGNAPRGLTYVPNDLHQVVSVAAGEFYNLALRRDGTVVAWGDRWDDEVGNYIPMDVPAGLSEAAAIAGGSDHALALRRDGTVVVWGWNAPDYSVVAESLSNVVEIAAGYAHNLALLEDGNVVCWGGNLYGQINAPAEVTNIVAVAAGSYHSLALRADGMVIGWGLNNYGQASVPSGLSNVVAVAAGWLHSLALRADGTVVAWGNNSYGQTSVPSGLSEVVAIAAGFDHSMALQANGRVVCWGRNHLQQTNVPPDLYEVVALAGGGSHSVAVKGEGTPQLAPTRPVRWAKAGQRVAFRIAASGEWPLSYQWLYQGMPIPGANKPWLVLGNVRPEDAGDYQVVVQNAQGAVTSQTMRLEVEGPPATTPPQVVAWGYNAYGQTNVPPGLSNVVWIACGEHHNLALKRDGTVVAWGDNTYFQRDVPPWLSGVIQVAAGYAHNVALLDDGTVVAWGDNSLGQLNVPPSLMNVVAVSANSAHTLALLEDGSVAAWGANVAGQCDVPLAATNVIAVSAGEDFSLALRADGTVVGWGDNTYGQAAPPAGLSNVVAIAAGGNHSLALRADGKVVGWGNNDLGQISIPSMLSNVVAIAAGGEHSMALRRDGTVMVWGDNGHGQQLVPLGLSNVVAVAAGFGHCMALVGQGPPYLLPQVLTRWAGFRGNAVFSAQATGQWPLSFQWNYWFGSMVPLPGFTNRWWVENDIVPSITGYYVLEVQNALGTVTSEPLWLKAEADTPPVILLHPEGQIARVGSTVSFSVEVEATPPATFQWFFGSQPLAGATNVTLTLTNVRSAQAGYYWVRASNSAGSEDSFPAYLKVIEQDPFIEINGVYKADGRHILPDDMSVTVVLTTAFPNGSIYYSTNNLHPDDGRLYLGPFEVRPPVILKAIAYSSNRTEWTAVVTNRLEIGWEFPLMTGTPGGGAVAVNPLPGPYPSNTVVTLTAMPAPGWSFLRWEGDAAGTNAVTQVVMNQPRQVQAIFGTAIPVGIQGGGIVQFDPPGRVFPYGSRVRLSALPNAGNYFQQWILGGATNAVSPLDLVLTNPGPAVTASFAPLPLNSYALTTLIVGGGKVQRTPPANYYANGTPVLLTATPDPGFIFGGWSGDLSGTNAVTGLVMNANRVITAHFIDASRLAIIQQPRSQVAQVGQTVTLSVRAVGANLQYTWFHDGMPLEGAQSSELVFPAITTSNAGRYQVLVSNDLGEYEESDAALVTVNTAPNPVPQALMFIGTMADEAALAVAVASNAVYVGGVVETGAGEAFGVRVPANFTTNTSPLWQTIWPGRPGADGFMGVLATPAGPVFAGYSEPLLSAARAAKGVLVQLGATNGLEIFSRRTPLNGAFDFNGAEYLHAITRSAEPAGEFWYVTGQGQSSADNYGQMFVAKVTPGGGEVWVGSESKAASGSDTLGVIGTPGFAVDLPVDYSVGNAVVVMGGAVFVAGRSDIEGVSYGALWKFSQDGRLLWRQLGTAGEYYGLAVMDGALYVVGAADNFWSGQDFLVERWDPEGWMEWSRTYDRLEQDDVLTAVVANGMRIYACGYTYGGTAGGADAVLLRFDPSSGDLLSTFLDGDLQDDFANALALDGQYLFVAGATASGGAGGVDAVLRRFYLPDFEPNIEPVGFFVSPADGAELVAPATVTLEVSASDADGSVTAVQFYQNGALLGRVSAPPYRMVVSNLWADHYEFSARVFDSYGMESLVAPVRITVNNYAASHSLDFEGVALNLNGVSLPLTLSNYLRGFEARVVNLTPGSTVQVVRASQVYPGLVKPSSGSNILEHFSASRGPVTNRFEFNQVLDSVRFTRVTVLAGAAGANHPRWRARAFNRFGMELSAVGENALFSPQDIPARTFTLTGPDIAAVVFESDAQGLGRFSSLLLDDMVLNVALSSNSAPLVVITQPANKAQFDGPASVTVRVVAEDYDGRVDSVALTVNGNWLDWTNNTGAGRFEPSFVLSNLVVGTYRLVAVAYDDQGASRESAPVSFSVVAPAPTNDNFATPALLSGITATYSGNSAGATFEPGEPYHAGAPGGRSVWFAWTAPQDGLVMVTTAGSTFDTVAAVYTGASLMFLEEVASNDDDPSQTEVLTSRLWFAARRGRTYYVAVDGYNGAGGFYSLMVSMNMPPAVTWLSPVAGTTVVAPGPVVLRAQAQDSDGVARVEFYRGNTLLGVATNQPPSTPFTGQITLTNVAPGEYYLRARAVDAAGVAAETQPVRVTARPPAAGNDMFANARWLAGPAVSVTDDNRSATLEPDEPDPWGGMAGNSLWYRWTAPASGTVLISTLGSSFDTLLEVYTGSALANLQLAALDDDGGSEVTAAFGGGGSGASLLTLEVTAGTTYYIAVKGYMGAGGDVRLSIIFNTPPTVLLTLNTNLARFTAPGIIPLVASVIDDQGVKRVDFFLNEQWVGTSLNPTATNRFTATLTLTNLPAGDQYVFTARAVDDLGAMTWTPPLEVTILGLAEQPQILAGVDTLEVVRGETIELSVQARGTPPLQYQWFFNGFPLWGANSGTLIIPNASPANSGLYFARVSNAYGFEVGQTTEVRVFVPPVITVPPASVVLPPGTSAVFTVTAVGTPPLRYQWYRYQTALPGAAGPTLVITNVSPWEMGAYTVVVSNRAGQAQATAQLTVSAVLAPPASAPRDDFWVPDGPVHAVAEYAGTLYLGGNFRMVGPNSGLGVALDAESARPDTVWPRVEGVAIYAAVPDGKGGWYIGGDFSRVGGLPRTNLAHLLPDKTVDASWVLNVNGPVRALLLDDQILYVGGAFTQVGGQARANLAAIRTQDGTVRAFAPNPDGQVRALARVDSKLYVGGDFQTIGGLPRARLAKVDPSDGEVRTDFVIGVDRMIHAFLVDDERLFVAGEFDTLTNNNVTFSRPKMAVIDTENRQILGWQAPLPAGPNARVYALARLGDTVYAGGDFTFTSGNVTYRHLAAFGRTDGAVRAWNPGAGGVVRALAAVEEAIYVGGAFLTMGGQSRLRMAAVHPTTGAVLDWRAPANGVVRALVVQENTVFAGGQFTLAGGVMRSNVAALRLATGQTTSWNPGANGPVRAVLVSGTNVYLGGEFTAVGGVERSRLAAVSVLSGATTAWNPGANGTVRALAVAGKRLYAGGDFTTLAGVARSRAGALDVETAAVLDWNPAPDGAVLAMRSAANGGQIYLAGEFNSLNGVMRPFLARVDAGGALDAWNPSPNAPVMALALRETPALTVYAGGSFSQIGGAPRQRLAAVDDSGLAVPEFAPPVQSATGDVAVVRALGLRQSTLDVGGWFHRVGGADRGHLAGVDAVTGAVAEWNPDLTVPAQALGVQALAAATNVVIVGGDFTRVGGDWRPNLAVFAPRGAPIIVGQPQGRVVLAGGMHQLMVTARGAWPLYFQWRLNGVNLPGATNATLLLTNIQLAQCGAYSVVASTPYGVAESQPANVLLAAPQVALGDRFTNSVSLPAVASGLVRGQNTEATGLQDDLLPSGFKRGGRSVWATWVAPTNGVVTFSTLGSTFDTLLTVLQGNTLNSLVLVERDEDSAGNLNEQVTFPVSQGNTYHILVDGVEGANGIILLSWNLLAGVADYPIITDQPRSRTVPENAPVNLQVTAQNAAGYQWFFRGQPITGATAAAYSIAAMTRELAGPYQVIAYGVNPAYRAQSRVFVLEVGQLVQSNQTVVLEDVRTHDKFDDMLRGGGPGGQVLGGPERQFFASVSAGSSGTQVLDNYGATTEPNEPQHGGIQGGASRWFRIDTLTNGVLVIDTIGSDIDTVLAVYQGQSLLTLQLVASDDNGAPDGVRSLVRVNALAKQSYLVAVDGVNGAEGHIVLNYLLAAPPAIVTPPVNQSAASGGSASFGVTATGTAPLSYQWYQMRSSQTNWLPVAGGTNAALSLTNVQAGDAGTFQVVVSNPAASVTSAVATLTVEAPLRFATGGGASYSNGVFTLNISGKAGQMFVIQASTNLTTWTPISTNLATGGQVQFMDTTASGGRRYYRAVGLE